MEFRVGGRVQITKGPKHYFQELGHRVINSGDPLGGFQMTDCGLERSLRLEYGEKLERGLRNKDPLETLRP